MRAHRHPGALPPQVYTHACNPPLTCSRLHCLLLTVRAAAQACTQLPRFAGAEALAAAAEQRLGQLFPAPASEQEAKQRAALALSHRSCAHLGCSNVASGCEAQAWRCSKKCGGCRRVRYCGEECCRADWRAHRRVCAALVAAAAPPSPASPTQDS